MTIRRSMADVRVEKIIAIGDRQITEAVTPPDVPMAAWRMFAFLRENENLCTVAGGMDHFVTGLDRSRLAAAAREMYGIDISRFREAVTWYESGMLKLQSEQKSNKS